MAREASMRLCAPPKNPVRGLCLPNIPWSRAYAFLHPDKFICCYCDGASCTPSSDEKGENSFRKSLTFIIDAAFGSISFIREAKRGSGGPKRAPQTPRTSDFGLFHACR